MLMLWSCFVCSKAPAFSSTRGNVTAALVTAGGKLWLSAQSMSAPSSCSLPSAPAGGKEAALMPLAYQQVCVSPELVPLSLGLPVFRGQQRVKVYSEYSSPRSYLMAFAAAGLLPRQL